MTYQCLVALHCLFSRLGQVGDTIVFLNWHRNLLLCCMQDSTKPRHQVATATRNQVPVPVLPPAHPPLPEAPDMSNSSDSRPLSSSCSFFPCMGKQWLGSLLASSHSIGCSFPPTFGPPSIGRRARDSGFCNWLAGKMARTVHWGADSEP